LATFFQGLAPPGFTTLPLRGKHPPPLGKSVEATMRRKEGIEAMTGRDKQGLLASRLLAELDAEDEFDRAIAASADKLAVLAKEALAEHRAGLTQELDQDRLSDGQ
jgi:hypothetical protein